MQAVPWEQRTVLPARATVSLEALALVLKTSPDVAQAFVDDLVRVFERLAARSVQTPVAVAAERARSRR